MLSLVWLLWFYSIFQLFFINKFFIHTYLEYSLYIKHMYVDFLVIYKLNKHIFENEDCIHIYLYIGAVGKSFQL